MSEQVAESLEAASFSAAPYHAGLDAQTRSRTQETFQRGEIDVVVATIAFGMGIDKADIRTVIHLGLPSTVEGYYQEIGRAGRDGLPRSGAAFLLLCDRKMHESFLTRDYPETRVLEKMRARVSQDGVDRAQLLAASGLELAAAEAALTKLWIHGGVTIDSGDVVRPGEAHWQPRYEAIRTYRYGQLDEVLDFAQSGGCRMARLIRHFGETRDSKPCGLCDACRPRDCVGRRFLHADQSPTFAGRRHCRRAGDAGRPGHRHVAAQFVAIGQPRATRARKCARGIGASRGFGADGGRV